MLQKKIYVWCITEKRVRSCWKESLEFVQLTCWSSNLWKQNVQLHEWTWKVNSASRVVLRSLILTYRCLNCWSSPILDGIVPVRLLFLSTLQVVFNSGEDMSQKKNSPEEKRYVWIWIIYKKKCHNVLKPCYLQCT